MKHAPKGRIKAKEGIDPMAPSNPLAGQCTATNRQGKRCGRPHIPGGNVCRFHGGAAPQVKAKALERLMALQHPAIDRLEKLIHQDEYPSTAFAAARDVLDRTLGKAHESVSVEHDGAVVIKWQTSES